MKELLTITGRIVIILAVIYITSCFLGINKPGILKKFIASDEKMLERVKTSCLRTDKRLEKNKPGKLSERLLSSRHALRVTRHDIDCKYDEVISRQSLTDNYRVYLKQDSRILVSSDLYFFNGKERILL